MMHNTRTFRAPVATVGLRQRVALGREEPLSRGLIHSVALVVVIAVVAVFGISQFIHWGYESNAETLTQLQSVRKTVGSEKISLLAARAQLMSESHVEAVAAARFQLFLPEKGQLHQL
ncbi:MAG: hypothetical protein DSY58_05310 [Desulfobulbus sp.]|nr:MAG: hypothetical protein DSY58_05310 [Desulfobulbus sp.]